LKKATNQINQATGHTVNVKQKEIRVTVTATNRQYDGTKNVNVGFNVDETGIKGERAGTVGSFSGTVTDKNVGTHAVTLVNNGFDLADKGTFLAKNYQIDYQDTDTVTIKKKKLYLVWDGKDVVKKYNGNRDAAVGITLVGLIQGETGKLNSTAIQWLYADSKAGKHKLIKNGDYGWIANSATGANYYNYQLEKEHAVVASGSGYVQKSWNDFTGTILPKITGTGKLKLVDPTKPVVSIDPDTGITIESTIVDPKDKKKKVIKKVVKKLKLKKRVVENNKA
jgi:hypothetical protein